MFKAGQGVTVTDGDGVQDNCDNEFLFDYFLCHQRGFKMNDSVSTREMETILGGKGGMQ